MQSFTNFMRRRCALRRCLAAGWAVVSVLALASSLPVHAAQVDIHGPAGHYHFGAAVIALPNGNFVVTSMPGTAIGAVHLYRADGTLISTLSGGSNYDWVGDSVIAVGDSNFVVISPYWKNSVGTSVGAVTWVNGTTGLSGVVSAGNSLVGTRDGDRIGRGGVIVLSNGNYVVSSTWWSNGVMTNAGAVTWGDGNHGISGRVSTGNSLVGTTHGDSVGLGGITALSNGNYVVASPIWGNGTPPNGYFGAVTWGNGNSGVRGPVSASNSLVGTTHNDSVGLGGITALSNGNYVVASPRWSNGEAGPSVGAATWGNGSSGIRGPVSASNSLIGTTTGDEVGSRGVTALSNGNYVVSSPDWNNGVWGRSRGAATWGNGRTGSVGVVSVRNSLYGATNAVAVGSGGITALRNGNYVVASLKWNDGTYGEFGAATWGNGDGGSAGPVSAGNSLVGSTPDDRVGAGYGGVTALANGNYVVPSPYWNNQGIRGVGAVTWGNGGSGVRGEVSASNSLIGTTADDQVGHGGITALTNGNYVVASPYWNNGTPDSRFGAATWANGGTGTAGSVSPENSLVGTTINDLVSFAGIAALSGGNYVVASGFWDSGAASFAGAVTWGHGGRGIRGAVSAGNSLVGTSQGDQVGVGGVFALGDGNYLANSHSWHGTGAVTLTSGGYRLRGTIEPWNSALGEAPYSGDSTTFDYDPVRHRLIVGWPAASMVSIFTMDQILAGDFDP